MWGRGMQGWGWLGCHHVTQTSFYYQPLSVVCTLQTTGHLLRAGSGSAMWMVSHPCVISMLYIVRTWQLHWLTAICCCILDSVWAWSNQVMVYKGLLSASLVIPWEPVYRCTSDWQWPGFVSLNVTFNPWILLEVITSCLSDCLGYVALLRDHISLKIKSKLTYLLGSQSGYVYSALSCI